MWIVAFIMMFGLDPVFSIEESDIDNQTDAQLNILMEDYLNSVRDYDTVSHRTKRHTSPLTDDIGVDRLQMLTPVSQLCNSSIFSKFLDVNNTTYAICISAAMMDVPAEVVIGVYEENRWIPSRRWYVFDPQGLVAFYTNGNIFILVAESDRGDGTLLTRIDTISREKVNDHTVNSRHATSISLWEMKIYKKLHLAIANSPGHTMKSEIYIYEWMGGTYFDRYDIIHAYDVRSIEPFHIHNEAYLAVANFRKGKNQLKVDSEIFKFSLDKKRWVSYQKILTSGAMHWKFFTMGNGLEEEFFLAIANKGNADATSMIYKFVKDKFVPFQCLHTWSATSIAALPLNKGMVLAVANFNDFVHLYQYDGWRFVATSTQYSQGSMSSGVQHIVFHQVLRNSHVTTVLSVSNPRKPYEKSIFELSFNQENELNQWHSKSAEWCSSTLNQVETSEIKSANLLENVIYIDQPSITINGNLTFENGLSTEILQTPSLTEIFTNEVYDSTILLNLERLQNRLEMVKNKLDGFQEILNKSFVIDGDKTITSKLSFQDVVFNCEEIACHFNNIETNLLNGEDVLDWDKNLVFLNTEAVINDAMEIESIIADEIEIQSFIDEVDPKEFVTRTGNHTITALKQFENTTTANSLVIKGLLDGIYISQDSILLLSGYQNTTGNLAFDHIETSWIEMNSFVNGRKFSAFYEDVVKYDKDAVINGAKTFDNVDAVDLVLSPTSTINGIDIVDVYNHAFWKNGFQDIEAEMTFNSIKVENDILAPAGINDFQMTSPIIVDISDQATISLRQNFDGVTKIINLNVQKSLNGLETLQSSDHKLQMDILLNTGDQLVTGKKKYNIISLDEESYVDGTVDSVDLSKFKKLTLRKDKKIGLNRTWTFKNLIIKGHLSTNRISGYDLNSIYDRALKLTNEDLPKMVFKKPISIEKLESYNINNVNITRDLVLRNEDQVLTGSKTFREIVLEENVMILGNVNNLSMNFLNETILRIGNQVLESKILKGNVKVNKLAVLGSINGVPVNDLVTLDGRQNIYRARELINVTFQNIEANSVELNGAVNGIDVEAMVKDTMTKDGSESVYGTLQINGSIFSKGNLQADMINEIDMAHLWNNIVLNDLPQNISGEKHFLNTVTFDNLYFNNTIDGVSQWNIRNWMLNDVSQIVEADVIFTNGLSAKNIDVTGLINDKINLVQLNGSIVMVNEPVHIVGPVIFKNILSKSDLTMTGKIQNVKLSEEAVTLSAEKVLTGVKTFKETLIVEGDVAVTGFVDGISISELCSRAVLVDNLQNRSSLTIQGDVTLLGGGTIGGNIAGVNLEALQNIALTTKDMNFNGRKTFENLIIEGPITVNGKLGGEDLKHLSDNYMSLTSDQVIQAPMTFNEIYFERALNADVFDTETELLNGTSLSDLNKRILKINEPQNITELHHFSDVIFESDVFVAGWVNKISIPYGVMRRNQTNYIQTPKIFEKPVHVMGDVVMGSGANVQGVDVSYWAENAVRNDGKTYEIRGRKIFNNLSINDARVQGYIDGIKMSENNFLLIYGDQVVTGYKTFSNDVEISGSLTTKGFINGQDLSGLSTQTMQKDKMNMITGSKVFTKPLTIKNLVAPSISNVDLGALEEKMNETFNIKNLNNKITEVYEVLGSVQEALHRQAAAYRYYELYQTFNIPTALDWLHVPTEEQHILLLSDESCSITNCSSVKVFISNFHFDEFEPSQEIQSSTGVVMSSLNAWGVTYVIISSHGFNPLCYGNGPLVGAANASAVIYSWNGKSFEYFQSLDMKPVIGVKSFLDNKKACIIFLQLEHSLVYCATGPHSSFRFYGATHTNGGRKATVVQHGNETVLAMTTEDLSPRTNNVERQPVDIHFWNSEQSTFVIIQQIPTIFASSVLLFNYRPEYSSHLFLAISEGKIPAIDNEPKLLIYRYNEESLEFHKYQEIDDSGELESSVMKSELVLFCLNKQAGRINLYQLKGVSGFVLIDTVKSFGGSSLHSFLRRGEQYLAIAGHPDAAKILKSKMRG